MKNILLKYVFLIKYSIDFSAIPCYTAQSCFIKIILQLTLDFNTCTYVYGKTGKQFIKLFLSNLIELRIKKYSLS